MSVDFKEVRDSYALASFFEGLMGAKGKPVAGSIRYSACPSCGPSSDASVKCSVRNERWHCFACMKKGDVVDAAAKRIHGRQQAQGFVVNALALGREGKTRPAPAASPAPC